MSQADISVLRACATSNTSDPVVSERTEPDVDALAAALRADAGDLGEFAELLAHKLESALPRHTSVQRRRSGILGPKRVRRIAITLQTERLELLALDGRGVEAQYAKVSGGIVLKHETVGLDEWVVRLSAALADEARRSDEARRALGELLI